MTRQLRYRLARRSSTWPDRELIETIETEQAQLVQDVTNARDAGRLTDAQVELIFYHELWQRVVRRMPDRLLYEVEKRA